MKKILILEDEQDYVNVLTQLLEPEGFKILVANTVKDGLNLLEMITPDLLIVDDMGMKQLPRRSGEVLFEIIMRRYETRSTVMTSNRPLEDWGKLIGDVPSATAILDRFLHHAEVLSFSGKSYRLRKQRETNDSPAESSNAAIAPTGSEPSDDSSVTGKSRKIPPEPTCQS